jgi:hypothetical protein
MKKNALRVAAVVAFGLLTMATFKVYDMQTTRTRIVALISDATDRLRTTLSARGRGSMGDFASHASALDAQLAALRAMDTASMRRLADAADDALVTSREIVRRDAEMHRLHRSLTLNVDQLRQHMKSDRGAASWTREAVRLKSAVDKDSRDYKIAVESYASLLESYPASQAKLAPYVRPELLIGEKLLSEARQQALDAYAGEDQNVRRVTAIQSYRLGDVRTR